MKNLLSLGRTAFIAFAVLGFGMAATRIGHFGDTKHLPDMSLALFFLGGLFYTRGKTSLVIAAALCGLAAALDTYAVTKMGVSSYCMTPAYGGLMLTYLSTWGLGMYAQQRSFHVTIAFAAVAMTLAFFTSNFSFWLLAGYFDNMSMAEYFSRVVPRYAMSYISTGFLYSVFGLSVNTLASAYLPKLLRSDLRPRG